MERWGRQFAGSFFLTLLLFIVTRMIWGFYYEEYEALFDAFYSGKMSPGTPFYSWYFMGNIGVSYLYATMYQYIASVEWMSWILYFYMLISCSLQLFLIKSIFKDRFSKPKIIIIQLFVWAVFMTDNLIHFNYTRVSYYMCGTSLFALIYLFLDGTQIRRHWVFFLFLNMFFLLGTLTRLESSMAATSLLLAFGFYQYERDKKLLHLFKLFAFPTVVVIAVFAGIMYDIHHSDLFYKQVEPDIETQFTSRENYVPIGNMKTHIDSLKYMAAIEMVWGDPKVVTVGFMRSLLKQDSGFFQDAWQWNRVRNEMKELMHKYWYFALFNILLAALYLILSFPSGSLQSNILFVLLQLSVWAIVTTQTYSVKVNDRSFFPLITLFSFGNILLVIGKVRDDTRLAKLILAGICIFGLSSQLIVTSRDAHTLYQEREDYRYNLKVLHNVTGDNIIALNASSYRFFMVNNEPFKPFNFGPFNKVYINEAQVLPTVHTYHEYLEKECKCDVNDFSNFYRFLQKSDKKVFFLSMEDRMDLIRKYLKGVHEYDLNIKEVNVPGFRTVYDHEMAYIVELKIYTFK